MNWAARLFQPEQPDSTADVAPRLPGSARILRAPHSLPDRVDALIRHQATNWPMLREGYMGLGRVTTKLLESPEAPGSYVIVQHNPARIRSTAARVDHASIQSRKCFLCPQNLPPEEMVLEYDDDFVIACNPFPVLDRHLSIIHRQHVEQRINGNVETLLGLARDLGPDYFVLYNGPRCGASAPDHLHLQACSRSLLPIEAGLTRVEPVRGPRPAGVIDPDGSVTVGVLEDFGRNLIVLTGTRSSRLTTTVNQLLINFASPTADHSEPNESEPMINMICTHDSGLWTLYFFARARHRPARFFAESDERITVSPGAIDMAGVIVVPRHEDFSKIGVVEAIEIFSEVSAGRRLVRELAESL